MADIDKLKDLIKATSGLVVALVKDVADDGKLKFNEVIGLIPEALKVIKQIPNFKEVIEEVKDFDGDDAQELIAFIQEDSGIPEGCAMVVLDNCIEIYSKAMDIYDENITPIIDIIKD